MNQISHVKKRKLTPDLARGFMLLFIALAHANQFIFSTDLGVTLTDQFTVFFRQVFIDGRAFPLFAILFGYGLHQVYKGQERKGTTWKDTKKIFRRRGAWMLVIGFFHATLFFADIIGVYGFIALLFASLFLRLSTRKSIILTIFFLVLVGLFAPSMPRGFDALNMEVTNSATIKDPFEASITRMVEWMFYTPVLSYQVIPGVLMGILVARFQVIDHPIRHKKALLTVGILGLFLSTAGGIPMALMSSLFWTSYSDGLEAMAKSLHTITGYAGGVGWTALIGLFVIKVEGKSGRFTKAIAALGQRSLSFYLFQSVMFVLILAPYAGGLGGHINQLWSDVVAVLVWIFTVMIAHYMDQRSIRGPFETILRKKSAIKQTINVDS
ncbi:DUF418 domain-containing protein [Rossellomorea yichunensis]|uniref:DUF418 domain-containing protein n=1 Tax=Rossellomorea yichunensis TaxID=3077331 RepID=UPI0028DE32AE|nr:DUF418 domain-containing protein [Rossellomorea sp. YC4-1]MDT9025567.1 DUF418 domain-containing protein [Rossellomorea sp. YC4-1]